MAEYGVEIRDADGNIILDNERMTQRMWHSDVYQPPTETGQVTTVTYDEPLDHEPTVFVLGIDGNRCRYEHRKSGEMWVGVNLFSRWYENVASLVLVVAFAGDLGA